MPGIFGLIDKRSGEQPGENPWFEAALKSMARVMGYESWYVGETYSFPALGSYLGYAGHFANGLACNQQKETGLSLLLSNWPSLGIESRMDGDRGGNALASGILKYYEKAGQCFPEIIGGLNAGVLIDEKRNACFLFNDRFGIERLFLYEDDAKLVFSSEAKAILAVIPATRSFDPVGLGEFLACGCTLGGNSLFRDIRVMPPGTVIKFAKGLPPIITGYVDHEALEGLWPLQEEPFLETFTAKLSELVNLCLQFPGRAGISLTGGLDSRMIMANLASDHNAICYTFGSMYRETYDFKIAKEVAKKCGQSHRAIVLDNDFLTGFEAHLKKSVFVSDGYLGFSGAAELYLNSLARGLAPIRITGNYGGELLRGVRAFKSTFPKQVALRPELRETVECAMLVFSQMSMMHPTSFTLFLQAPSGYGRYAVERSQVSQLMPFLETSLVGLIYRMPFKFKAGADPSVAIIQACNKELALMSTDRGNLLGGGGQIGKLARGAYRGALFKLEYITDHGMPDKIKWASCFNKGRLFGHLFLGRHKFQHFGKWSRNQLANYIWGILATGENTSLDNYIDFKDIKNMFVEHQSGRTNLTTEIDKLTTLILADRQFFGSGMDTKPLE